MKLAAEIVDGPSEQRKAERRTTGIRSALRPRGMGSVPVQVVDISAEGCKVEVRPTPYAGSTVWLKLPGLEPWYAKVAWVGDDCAGLQFSQPLHPAVVERFVSAARS